jgi:hypothetical protein
VVRLDRATHIALKNANSIKSVLPGGCARAWIILGQSLDLARRTPIEALREATRGERSHLRVCLQGAGNIKHKRRRVARRCRRGKHAGSATCLAGPLGPSPSPSRARRAAGPVSETSPGRMVVTTPATRQRGLERSLALERW